MEKPGTVVDGWSDGCSGHAVILSTSRHKSTFDRDEAEALLRDEIEGDGDVVGEFVEMTWRSHTKKYLREYGCTDECNGTEMCSDGDGKAWQRVLYADRLYE